MEDENCGKKKKQNRLKGNEMGGMGQTKFLLQDSTSPSVAISAHLKWYLLYNALLDTLVSQAFCLVLDRNTPVFSLDSDSLIKGMCLINHFIPCRVTHNGWLTVCWTIKTKLNTNWQRSRLIIKGTVNVRIQKYKLHL